MKKLKYIFIIVLSVNFAACNMEQKLGKYQDSDSEEQLIQRGKSITQATFQTLSQELQKSMKEGGVEKAIAYCNINALPITDQLANEHNAIIKRTSLKYRNPENAPTKAEIDILHEFQDLQGTGKALKPKLVSMDNQNVFYAPIVMQDLCLKCHGSKQSIEAYDQILSKYPDDLATGYEQGDLRGMWSVALLPTKN